MYVQLYTIQHEIIALFDLLYITFQLDADSCSTVLQNQSICTSFNRIVLEVTHFISSPLNAMRTQAMSEKNIEK